MRNLRKCKKFTFKSAGGIVTKPFYAKSHMTQLKKYCIIGVYEKGKLWLYWYIPACFSTPKKDRERDSLMWEGEPWIQIPTTIHRAHSFSTLSFPLSFSHTHTAQSLRAGQGERPDYSRWVLCSWGLAKRWEEGEDKQTVCLLSDYSTQSVCMCVFISALPVVVDMFSLIQ